MKTNPNIFLKFRPLFCLALLSALLGSCDRTPDYNDGYDNTTAATEVGRKLVAGTGLIGHLIDDRSWTVTDGVEATEIAYVSYEGYTTKMFVVEADLSNPSIHIAASLPDNGTTFKMQPMTRQALAADAPGNKVWAGFNADFFNMTTGVPRGPVHRNGVMLKNTFDNGERSVFYITDDKRAAVAHRDDYPAINAGGTIREAVGGGVMLLTGGELVTQEDEDLEPRTAVGVSEDGKTVWFLVVDGRNWSWSNGMRFLELAISLRSLGAHDAINLDGGGSTTFLVRTTPEFTDDRFKVCNWPSDNGGKERAVADGLLIISNR